MITALGLGHSCASSISHALLTLAMQGPAPTHSAERGRSQHRHLRPRPEARGGLAPAGPRAFIAQAGCRGLGLVWAALSVCSGWGSAIGCLCSEFSGNQACKPWYQLRASMLRAPHLARLEKPQDHHL